MYFFGVNYFVFTFCRCACVTTSVKPVTTTLALLRRGIADIFVNLARRKEAMTAIIYSEILGRPKALREGPDSWER